MQSTLYRSQIGFKEKNNRLSNLHLLIRRISKARKSRVTPLPKEEVLANGLGRADNGNEPDLIERAVGGDTEALVALYRENLEQVYRYVYRRVGRHEDAEDLTSEVFCQMVKSLKTFQGEGSFEAWLRGIARHVVAHWWETRYSLPFQSIEILLERGFEPPVATQPGGSSPDVALIDDLLAGLPAKYRQVLQLRFLTGLTVDETATEMGLTPGNVRVTQHRALKAATRLNPKVAVAPTGEKEGNHGGE